MNVLGLEGAVGPVLIFKVDYQIDRDTKLIVPPSCEAVVTKDGEVLGVYGEGAHAVNSDERGFFAKLFKKDEKPMCRVYFVNKTVPLCGFWGTPSKIEFRESETNIPVSLGACGAYKLTVANSLKVFKRLLGLGSIVDSAFVEEYFRSEINTYVRDEIYNVMVSGAVPFLELAGSLKKLGEIVADRLTPYFAEFGLQFSSFTVDSVAIDDDIKKLVRDFAMKAYREKMGGAIEQPKPVEPPKPQPEDKKRRCVRCAKIIDGAAAFCPHCGVRQASKCECGYISANSENFCPICGRRLKGD